VRPVELELHYWDKETSIMSDSASLAPLTPAIPGLVWAYRFQPGPTPCVMLPTETLPGDLEAGDGFLWLHLNLADARVAPFLESMPDLSPAVIAALTTHDTHAALMMDERSLYGTLVDFQRDFDNDTRDIGWLHFSCPSGSSSRRGCSPYAPSTGCARPSRRTGCATGGRWTCSRRWSRNSSAP
jgi:hypothetical protein